MAANKASTPSTRSAVNAPAHSVRPSSSPDAQLLALCAEHSVLVAARNRPEIEDAFFDELVSQACDLLHQMTAIPAQTVLGIRAKALALATDDPYLFVPGKTAVMDDDLVASLIADILGINRVDRPAAARLRAGQIKVEQIMGVPA